MGQVIFPPLFPDVSTDANHCVTHASLMAAHVRMMQVLDRTQTLRDKWQDRTLPPQNESERREKVYYELTMKLARDTGYDAHVSRELN